MFRFFNLVIALIKYNMGLTNLNPKMTELDCNMHK